MKEQNRNSIYCMTDRELRLRKWKIRRQREMRRKVAACLFTVCLIAAFVISFRALSTSANNGEDEVYYKYYTSVIAKRGETVWDLADDYIDYGKYKDKNAYIEEVCSINNLDEYATIKAGQRVTFPYYSTEFVR